MRSEQCYEATVPDTLDLAERARVAVNALIEALDLDCSPAFCPRYGIMARGISAWMERSVGANEVPSSLLNAFLVVEVTLDVSQTGTPGHLKGVAAEARSLRGSEHLSITKHSGEVISILVAAEGILPNLLRRGANNVRGPLKTLGLATVS